MEKVCEICGSKDFKIKSKRFCSQDCIHTYGSRMGANNKKECSICKRKISPGNFKKHLKTHIKKEIHYYCENCGKECFESYGSNRFCSKECARGFSTKAKRKEINRKVSEKLKGVYNGVKTEPKKEKIKICPVCQIEFKTFSRIYCSKSCAGASPRKPIKDTSNMGGLRPGGGKSKQTPYTNWLGYKMSLNKEEIKVANILDKHKINWDRNRKGFPYQTIEGKNRNYFPDFKLLDEEKFIEYKGWITEEMHHKMKDAVEKNNLDLTILVGEDKRYKEYGLSLEEFDNLLGL